MAKVFQNYVHVTNPETGETRAFKPGDECPRSLEDLVDENNFEGGRKKGATNPGGTGVNYDSLKKPELEDLAADRGLDFEGTRADIIARLEENDAANG